MGICKSHLQPQNPNDARVNNEIDRRVIEDHEADSNRLKLLLLGSGESGKSTVLKQLRLLYGKPMTEEELAGFRKQIHDNIFETIESLCRICAANFPDDPILDTPEFKKLFPKDGDWYGGEHPELTFDYVGAISSLWSSEVFQAIWSSAFPSVSSVAATRTLVAPDPNLLPLPSPPGFSSNLYASPMSTPSSYIASSPKMSSGSYITPIQQSQLLPPAPVSTIEADVSPSPALVKRQLVFSPSGQTLSSINFDSVIKYNNNFVFNEGVKVFLDKIQEVYKRSYAPSESDILTVRMKTIGVRVEKLLIQEREYYIHDVGGQKNERKKWLHCFSDVHGVLFLTALNEYDNYLREDNKTNRMVDSIDLFHSICEEKFLRNACIILFLNKSDLFKQKVATVPINSVPSFADYDGPPGDYQAGVDYFAAKFKGKMSPKRLFYQHVTCAIDGQSMRVVFDVCRVVITKAHLMNTGFIS